MDLTIQMEILHNAKYRHAVCLKLGDRFFTSLITWQCQANASICSAIKENLILYSRKFSALVLAVVN